VSASEVNTIYTLEEVEVTTVPVSPPLSDARSGDSAVGPS